MKHTLQQADMTLKNKLNKALPPKYAEIFLTDTWLNKDARDGPSKTTCRGKKMCIKIQSTSEKMEFQTLAERQVFGRARQKLGPAKLCARNAERCPKETSGGERKGTSQSKRSGAWVKCSGTLLNGPLSAWGLTRKSLNSSPSGGLWPCDARTVALTAGILSRAAVGSW